MRKVIIVGATSGIGEALAREMHNSGYQVGLTGRRLDRLQALQEEFGEHCHIAQFDVQDAQACKKAIGELTNQMGSIDVLVINAGMGSSNPAFPLDLELETVSTNVVGFTAIANLGYHLFVKQGHGHLVGISSVAGVRGGSVASYHASKAYVSSYLEGIACRTKVQQAGIHVSDIRPGFVDTAMGQGEKVFWMASPERAAQQILTAIHTKKRVAYITKRWGLIAFVMRLAPFALYKRFLSG